MYLLIIEFNPLIFKRPLQFVICFLCTWQSSRSFPLTVLSSSLVDFFMSVCCIPPPLLHVSIDLFFVVTMQSKISAIIALFKLA